MAEDRSSAGIITVVVAVITVAGGIAVALINNSSHKHSPKQPPGVSDGASPGQTGGGPVGGAAQQPAGGAGAQGVVVAPALMGPLQMNMGLMGGTDYANPHADSAAECSDKCGSDSKCVAMTYLTDTKVCYLKYKVTSMVPAGGMVTALKQ